MREVLDIGIAFLIFVLVLLSNIRFAAILTMKSSLTRNEKLLEFLKYVICCFFVAWIHPYKDLPHLLTLISLSFFGLLYGHKNQIKGTLWLLILSSSLILTQFGSNNSATYLIPPYILGACLFAFLKNPKHKFEEEKSSKHPVPIVIAVLLLAICLTLFSLEAQAKNTSYEADSLKNELHLDSQTSLYFSKEKIESIRAFRTNSQLYGDLDERRVLDLSFWHPGSILYLGKIPFPISTGDVTFRNSLDFQSDLMMRRLNLGEGRWDGLIIIRTVDIIPRNVCKKLSDHMTDKDIASTFKNKNFDPLVSDISIYKSTPVDLTLYPYNISLLKTCGELGK
jgi:hypothetical protein